MFLCRIKENYPLLSLKTPSYVELCISLLNLLRLVTWVAGSMQLCLFVFIYVSFAICKRLEITTTFICQLGFLYSCVFDYIIILQRVTLS